MEHDFNIISHIFSFITTNILISIISLIFTFILPSLLGAEIYGIYKFLLFVPTTIITYLPEIDFALNRFIPYFSEHDPQSIRPLIKWNLKIKLIGMLIGSIILLILFFNLYFNYLIYLYFLIPLLLLNYITPTFSSILYGTKKVKKFNLILLLYQITEFSLFIILFIFFGLIGSLTALLISYSFKFLLYLLYGVKYLNKFPKNNSNLKTRPIWLYTFPYYIATRLNYLSAVYGSFLIVYKFGIGNEIAYFLLTILILNLVITIGKSLRNAIFPHLVSNFEKNSDNYVGIIHDSTRYSYSITTFIALTLYIFGDIIIPLILGNDYIPMIPLIKTISVYLFFWGMINVFLDISFTQGKTWPNIIGSCIKSGIAISFYIILPAFMTVYEILNIYIIAEIFGVIFVGIYGLLKSKLSITRYLKLLIKMIICIISVLVIYYLNNLFLIGFSPLYLFINLISIILFIILLFTFKIIKKSDLKLFLRIFKIPTNKINNDEI
ncbi:MAG: hypothetical protein ACTSPY_13690 [Candidatus Helarchaeota archaeon]